MPTETGPPRRTVVANISLSLDGRVAGPGGEFDMSWIVPHAITDTARDHMISVTAPATTALLGRKNFVGFSSYWPGVAADETADRRDRAFSTWLNQVDKIVFSTTLREAAWENSRIVSENPADVIEDLRNDNGGDIIVLSSSSLIRELLRADALDRLSITLCPELPGAGARLFDDGLPPSSWTVRQSVLTESGAICVVYDRVR